MSEQLYHYTCAHSVNGIRRDGKLRPNRHPLLDMELVWLTDMEVPDLYALGLTSHLIRCRRTEFRAVCGDVGALHWPVLARELRRLHGDMRSGVAALESAVGVRPMHWWVSTGPVPVLDLEAVE